MDAQTWLPVLLTAAVLSPLISFAAILLAGPRMGKHGEFAAYTAISAIGLSCVLSFVALFGIWLPNHGAQLGGGASHASESHEPEPHQSSPDGEAKSGAQSARVMLTAFSESGEDHPGEGGALHEKSVGPHGDDRVKRGDAKHEDHGDHAEHDEAHVNGPPPFHAGTYYLLGQFGDLRLELSYYIDSLTVCMFCMVTLIATLIHFYASGYMHDELHDITDHEVSLNNGDHLHRPGRFHRFFQYLSLFCFSMLGLVLAGNVALVFVFWELVGVCSYFLIGFYVERKNASTAANKAFIVNRVGDFGMLIGLMALWSGIGTLSFGDVDRNQDGAIQSAEKGLFSLVRPAESDYQFTIPDRMIVKSATDKSAAFVKSFRAGHPEATDQEVESALFAEARTWRNGESGSRVGYWLLVIAGVGIFCGCVGKSAQFPLHVWLPDAMEGPTPVSALVHSATMVAAGVYLVGRFYPLFAPEALLVIAIAGCITLFMAATIAITATDIKRVLAYSTVSQLGYMMLALGVGGWVAGMMHLITHAFFKSLLFMCSGSVIHAVHTNEMTEMGGLRKKMPVTAYTMLVGCLAIAGASLPFVVGFSGYYSKDRILEQAFAFMDVNQSAFPAVFFAFAAGGAAITAFYMFRMWYLTFAGTPRNQEKYDHAHESPPVMYVPLVVLSVFAVAVAWTGLSEIVLGAGAAILLGLAVAFSRRGSSDGEHAESQSTSAHGHGSASSHAAHDGHGAHAGSHHHGHGESHGHDHGHGSGSRGFSLRYLVLALGIGGLLFGLMWHAAGMKHVTLANLLEQSRPVGTLRSSTGDLLAWQWPDEHYAHHHFAEIVAPVTLLAFGTALGGIALATVMYGVGWLSPSDVRRQFEPIYRFLVNKWFFDELYEYLFVRPSHVIGRFVAGIDRNCLDWLIDGTARVTVRFAKLWDFIFDRTLVDGTVNVVAGWLFALGVSMRRVQTGKLRQYIVFIAVGAIAVFILISFFWAPAAAGK